MCTAISYLSSEHYFGRNLDLEYSYNESVTVVPRGFPLSFRRAASLKEHYAIIGIATVADGYPLYYDATNEHGLSMAGLNFPGNACYFSSAADKDNIAPFELIPWILGQCKNVQEANKRLIKTNILQKSFNQAYPLTPLHWLISDQKDSLVVESVENGLSIYNNPIGVLTNNPPFDFHLNMLSQYMNLTSREPVNRFSSKIQLAPTSRGIGAFGLPGDPSSASRFIKAAFVKLNSVDDGSTNGAVSQFFHILESVAQQNGCVKADKKYVKTVYSSCCNTNKGIYYYKTYDNSQITAVDMHHENLDADRLVSFPLIWQQQINEQN